VSVEITRRIVCDACGRGVIYSDCPARKARRSIAKWNVTRWRTIGARDYCSDKCQAEADAVVAAAKAEGF
jgi:hypothetical protein